MELVAAAKVAVVQVVLEVESQGTGSAVAQGSPESNAGVAAEVASAPIIIEGVASLHAHVSIEDVASEAVGGDPVKPVMLG